TPATHLLQRSASVAAGLPDYSDLFGPFKLCDCEDCRSVLSPAAYLVDLLTFLKSIKATDDPTKTALDHLLERRPEIAQIDLTCANSNTVLPEIDLINELLENSKVIAQAFGGPPPDNDRQTTRDADVLVLSPEYVNCAVYDIILPTTVSPWTLPFDLGTEEARTY